MKAYEIRRKLRDARIAAQTAMEDYIVGARNSPHSTLARALMTARACRYLLEDPDCEYALKLLKDIENQEPYTEKL
jgi:hypothetical protein